MPKNAAPQGRSCCYYYSSPATKKAPPLTPTPIWIPNSSQIQSCFGLPPVFPTHFSSSCPPPFFCFFFLLLLLLRTPSAFSPFSSSLFLSLLSPPSTPLAAAAAALVPALVWCWMPSLLKLTLKRIQGSHSNNLIGHIGFSHHLLR
jgi:hypothetical protein